MAFAGLPRCSGDVIKVCGNAVTVQNRVLPVRVVVQSLPMTMLKPWWNAKSAGLSWPQGVHGLVAVKIAPTLVETHN